MHSTMSRGISDKVLADALEAGRVEHKTEIRAHTVRYLRPRKAG